MSSLQLLRRATLQLHQLTVRMMSVEKTRDPIVSSRQPNTFGTLGFEHTRTQYASLPDEDDDVERVDFLDGVEGKTKLGPAQKYCRLIKKHLQANELREALAILDERMKSECVSPDRYTYNLLISGCASKGYSKKAFQLFNQMKKRNIQFSSSTYTSLFNACANSPFPEDGLKRAIDLRELMKEKRNLPNETTCHAMIKAFGRCGNLELAFNVVDEMIDRKLFIGNGTYNFLLQACASDRGAGFRHAILVWRAMLSRKIKPTIYSYNALLRCVRDCSVGNMEVLHEDLQRMIPLPAKNQKLIEERANCDDSTILSLPASVNLPTIEAHLTPNLLLPNPQINAVVSLNDVKYPWQRLSMLGGVQGFLSTMSATRVTPDIKTFTLLLAAIEPTNETEKALMKKMRTMNVKWDLDFLNMLIKKRAMLYRFEDAMEAFNYLEKYKKKPNIMTFGVLALACQNISDAKQLFERMDEMGTRPNVEIIGSLFLRSSQKYDFEMMRFVLSKMRQNNIKPNKRFLEHVNKFEKRVETLFEKARREDYENVIATPEFKTEYQTMTEHFSKLKNSEIEDDSLIHPWAQFKRREVAAS